MLNEPNEPICSACPLPLHSPTLPNLPDSLEFPRTREKWRASIFTFYNHIPRIPYCLHIFIIKEFFFFLKSLNDSYDGPPSIGVVTVLLVELIGQTQSSVPLVSYSRFLLFLSGRISLILIQYMLYQFFSSLSVFFSFPTLESFCPSWKSPLLTLLGTFVCSIFFYYSLLLSRVGIEFRSIINYYDITCFVILISTPSVYLMLLLSDGIYMILFIGKYEFSPTKDNIVSEVFVQPSWNKNQVRS